MENRGDTCLCIFRGWDRDYICGDCPETDRCMSKNAFVVQTACGNVYCGKVFLDSMLKENPCSCNKLINLTLHQSALRADVHDYINTEYPLVWELCGGIGGSAEIQSIRLEKKFYEDHGVESVNKASGKLSRTGYGETCVKSTDYGQTYGGGYGQTYGGGYGQTYGQTYGGDSESSMIQRGLNETNFGHSGNSASRLSRGTLGSKGMEMVPVSRSLRRVDLDDELDARIASCDANARANRVECQQFIARQDASMRQQAMVLARVEQNINMGLNRVSDSLKGTTDEMARLGESVHSVDQRMTGVETGQAEMLNMLKQLMAQSSQPARQPPAQPERHPLSHGGTNQPSSHDGTQRLQPLMQHRNMQQQPWQAQYPARFDPRRYPGNGWYLAPGEKFPRNENNRHFMRPDDYQQYLAEKAEKHRDWQAKMAGPGSRPLGQRKTEAPVSGPSTGQRKTEAPVSGSRPLGQRKTEAPVSGPSTGQRKTEAPVSGPSTGQRKTEAPVSGQRKTEAPASEQRKTEAPASEQRKTEEPASEQRKTEAPASEQRKTEAPASEQRKPDGWGDQVEREETQKEETPREPTMKQAPPIFTKDFSKINNEMLMTRGRELVTWTNLPGQANELDVEDVKNEQRMIAETLHSRLPVKKTVAPPPKQPQGELPQSDGPPPPPRTMDIRDMSPLQMEERMIQLEAWLTTPEVAWEDDIKSVKLEIGQLKAELRGATTASN